MAGPGSCWLEDTQESWDQGQIKWGDGQCHVCLDEQVLDEVEGVGILARPNPQAPPPLMISGVCVPRACQDRGDSKCHS